MPWKNAIGERVAARISSRAWALALVCHLVGAFAFTSIADDGDERPQFEAAKRSLKDGFYDRATSEFSDFTNRFPNSTLKAEASQLALYAAAESAGAKKDYMAAAQAFANFFRNFPASELALDAYVREAETLAQAKEYARSGALIEQADGPFDRALKTGKPPGLLFRGLLTLAECRLQERKANDAVAALDKAAPFADTPVTQWDRLRLVESARELAGQPELAAEAVSQMLKLVDDPAMASRAPRARALAGDLYMQLNQLPRAAQAFKGNLGAAIPIEFRRDAVFKLGRIDFNQGDLTGARELLEPFLPNLAGDAEASRFRLLLGQVLFRLYQAERGATNPPSVQALALLATASADFDAALTNRPTADLVGPIQLGRGWCFWEDALNRDSRDRMAEAEAAFQAASTNLGPSLDQATARLRVADSQMWRGEPALALTNYLGVASGYTNMDDVRKQLIPAALEKAAYAAVTVTNLPAATGALDALRKLENGKDAAARSALQIGALLEKTLRFGDALSFFKSALADFKDTPSKPDLELELGVLEARVDGTTNSLAGLEGWLNNYPNHPKARRAEFEHALARGRAGNDVELARYAESHPKDPEAQIARLWLAQRLFDQADYQKAALTCMAIVTNESAKALPGGIWYQAKLWAAEASAKLKNYTVSITDLRQLLSEKGIPADVKAQAYLDLGDFLIESPPSDPQDVRKPFRDALEPFTRLTDELTNSPYAPAALGRAAQCYFQLGPEDPRNYLRATNAFGLVLSHPKAATQDRATAAIGLGLSLEKMAAGRPDAEAKGLLEQARDRFLDVALGRVLVDGETVPPVLLDQAAGEAGKLLEMTGRQGLEQAGTLYARMIRELPANAAYWQKKQTDARAALDQIKN